MGTLQPNNKEKKRAEEELERKKKKFDKGNKQIFYLFNLGVELFMDTINNLEIHINSEGEIQGLLLIEDSKFYKDIKVIFKLF